jgi:hypothetical protein
LRKEVEGEQRAVKGSWDIKNMNMEKIGILLVPHPRTKVHSYISLRAKKSSIAEEKKMFAI